MQMCQAKNNQPKRQSQWQITLPTWLIFSFILILAVVAGFSFGRIDNQMQATPGVNMVNIEQRFHGMEVELIQLSQQVRNMSDQIKSNNPVMSQMGSLKESDFVRLQTEDSQHNETSPSALTRSEITEKETRYQQNRFSAFDEILLSEPQDVEWARQISHAVEFSHPGDSKPLLASTLECGNTLCKIIYQLNSTQVSLYFQGELTIQILDNLGSHSGGMTTLFNQETEELTVFISQKNMPMPKVPLSNFYEQTGGGA